MQSGLSPVYSKPSRPIQSVVKKMALNRATLLVPRIRYQSITDPDPRRCRVGAHHAEVAVLLHLVHLELLRHDLPLCRREVGRQRLVVPEQGSA